MTVSVEFMGAFVTVSAGGLKLVPPGAPITLRFTGPMVQPPGFAPGVTVTVNPATPPAVTASGVGDAEIEKSGAITTSDAEAKCVKPPPVPVISSV